MIMVGSNATDITKIDRVLFSLIFTPQILQQFELLSIKKPNGNDVSQDGHFLENNILYLYQINYAESSDLKTCALAIVSLVKTQGINSIYLARSFAIFSGQRTTRSY